jgi:hypothetical protein
MPSSEGRFDIPKLLQIKITVYRCNQCGGSFPDRQAADDSLIKFVDEENKLECWLPTYTKGGYLDLLEKCVPGFCRNNEITMKVFREFEAAFEEYQHRPSSGGFWRVASGAACLQCSSRDLKIRWITNVVDPNLKWMTYDEVR